MNEPKKRLILKLNIAKAELALAQFDVNQFATESRIKPRGSYSKRKGKWDKVDWTLPQADIARQMGVTQPAVCYQMRKRGCDEF